MVAKKLLNRKVILPNSVKKVIFSSDFKWSMLNISQVHFPTKINIGVLPFTVPVLNVIYIILGATKKKKTMTHQILSCIPICLKQIIHIKQVYTKNY